MRHEWSWRAVWTRAVRPYGAVAIGTAILGAVLWAGRAELAQLRAGGVSASLGRLAPWQLALAMGLTVVSYALLAGYDLLALRYARASLGVGRTMVASVIAYGVSHTLGFPGVSGNAVRARFWSSWGLEPGEMALAIAFAGFTLTLAVATVAGLALVGEPPRMLEHLPLGAGAARLVGGTALVAVLGYLGVAARHGGAALRVGGRRVRCPDPGMAVAQVALGTVDWLLSAVVLYVLLPRGHAIGLGPFTAAFVLAQVLGLLSHVPGGLGVFETLMIVQLGDYLAPGALLGTLVAYRAIFYFAPFVASVGVLAAHEAWSRRRPLQRSASVLHRALGRWARAMLPRVIGVMTLGGGAMLLVSGATPALHGRLRMLVALLPLGIVELSHFTGSVVGASLLVIGWGLTRKLDAAWTLACGLLLAGIAASLLKGFDWEEALALSAILVILLPGRGLFYRRSSLTSEPLTRGWIVSILAIVAASVCVGLFSYQHVEYSQDLWWRFALRGDAPRFLRASVGGITTLGVMGLVRLVSHGRSWNAPPDESTLGAVRSILPTVPNVEANLALLGDKAFLVSEAGDAFLMYAVRGRSWVALRGPLGNPRELRELTLRFMELADRAGGWPVLYQVGPEYLPLAIELGFSILKLGEEAYVSLADFCLDGGRRKSLRRSHREAARGGATFEVVPRGNAEDVLPELARVSSAWLRQKATHEKGFSLGVFDPAYLRNFDVAVVRVRGTIVAFANILTAGNGDLSADLMRHDGNGPDGVMDFLFVELALWGRARGHSRMSLGMAPLSGLAPHAFSPQWTRLAAVLYQHGEALYNFRGLRRYKEKFDPVWEPRYLATTHRLALPRIVLDVIALISGGVRHLVAR